MDEQQPAAPEQPKRRPYVKPEIQSSELFERRSLVCGTTPSAPRQAGCGVYHQSV